MSAQAAEFIAEWNTLDRRDRARIRRMVRLGRARALEGDEAAIAVEYAQFQKSRMWTRYFWFWFVPGLIVALGVATTIHPIVIGIVLAMAAQAVLANRNLRVLAKRVT